MQQQNTEAAKHYFDIVIASIVSATCTAIIGWLLNMRVFSVALLGVILLIGVLGLGYSIVRRLQKIEQRLAIQQEAMNATQTHIAQLYEDALASTPEGRMMSNLGRDPTR